MLFTTGMTLLDSVDSILMLYSYTGFAEHRFRLFEPAWENDASDHESSAYRGAAATRVSAAQLPRSQGSHENETEGCPLSAAPGEHSSQGNMEQPVEVEVKDADAKIRDIRKEARRELIVKRNMMSGLRIVLTLMSIVVAFRCEFLPNQPPRTADSNTSLLCVSISLITIMGLIGDKCVTCREAGGWWTFWAEVRDSHGAYRTSANKSAATRQANNNSGYIGVGIVGSFVLVVGGWYGGRWVYSKWKG